jgi:hypothetical protein
MSYLIKDSSGPFAVTVNLARGEPERDTAT